MVSQRYAIRYQDHLIYHYLAGTVQALGKNYQRAIHLLTIVGFYLLDLPIERLDRNLWHEFGLQAVSAPGSAISQIQLDAYKKLILVSLLSNSSPPLLPPYTHPQFRTVFKTSNNNKAYLDLMSLYEHAETSSEAYMQLLTMAEKNLSNFQKVCLLLSFI
jgi:COP9 signalosome complex subunit 3